MPAKQGHQMAREPHAKEALGIEENPASCVLCICNFCNHRNILQKKEMSYEPTPMSLMSLSPAFKNFTNALACNLATGVYQADVVSKKRWSSRNRSSVCLSVSLSLAASAMHSSRIAIVGSISRRF